MNTQVEKDTLMLELRHVQADMGGISPKLGLFVKLKKRELEIERRIETLKGF